MDENDGIGALVDDFFKKEMVCVAACVAVVSVWCACRKS